MEKQVKRVSDVVPPDGNLDGSVTLAEVLGVDLYVEKLDKVSGKYGDLLVITAVRSDTDMPVRIRSGGRVVNKKLLLCEAKGELPILGKVVREKRYYDIA
ncbi:MAG: hypothetical protein DDT19_01770 [Syntrophomonadaceae bacterium]|nr:hypothetical protein [Bacillota bacterium]